MSAAERSWTSYEMMAVVVARTLRNDELGFIGVGTGRRGFAMGVGVPAVATRLAQHLHAPRFHVMFGPIIDPVLDPVSTPVHATEHGLIRWSGAAQVPVEDALGLFRSGRIDVGFVSGAQVDATGAVNVLEIHRDGGIVRLPGPLAQPDHATFARRTVVCASHSRRHLVPRVDRQTGIGVEADLRSRLAGRIGSGPSLVVTPAAVFGISDGRLTLASVHPGVTEGEVRDCGLGLPRDLSAVARTPPPTEQEIWLIRHAIDPKGIWLESRWYAPN